MPKPLLKTTKLTALVIWTSMATLSGSCLREEPVHPSDLLPQSTPPEGTGTETARLIPWDTSEVSQFSLDLDMDDDWISGHTTVDLVFSPRDGDDCEIALRHIDGTLTVEGVNIPHDVWLDMPCTLDKDGTQVLAATENDEHRLTVDIDVVIFDRSDFNLHGYITFDLHDPLWMEFDYVGVWW